MSKTVIGTNIEKRFIGYMVNAEFSPENKAKIRALQQQITDQFGDGVWCQPQHSLHITLFDWIAPLVDYGEDKDDLFEKIRQEYDQVVREALSGVKPLTVKFNKLSTAARAIFGTGNDNGQFAQIRQHYLDNVTLLPNTKLPPTIIHFTMCRFVQEIELEPIQQLIEKLDFALEETIDEFRLVREVIDPMIEYEILQTYKLGK